MGGGPATGVGLLPSGGGRGLGSRLGVLRDEQLGERDKLARLGGVGGEGRVGNGEGYGSKWVVAVAVAVMLGGQVVRMGRWAVVCKLGRVRERLDLEGLKGLGECLIVERKKKEAQPDEFGILCTCRSFPRVLKSTSCPPSRGG